MKELRTEKGKLVCIVDDKNKSFKIIKDGECVEYSFITMTQTNSKVIRQSA